MIEDVIITYQEGGMKMGQSLANQYARTYGTGRAGTSARAEINRRYRKRYGRNIRDDYDFV